VQENPLALAMGSCQFYPPLADDILKDKKKKLKNNYDKINPAELEIKTSRLKNNLLKSNYFLS